MLEIGDAGCEPGDYKFFICYFILNFINARLLILYFTYITELLVAYSLLISTEFNF